MCWCAFQEEKILSPCSTLSTSTSLLPRPKWVTVTDLLHAAHLRICLHIQLWYSLVTNPCEQLSILEYRQTWQHLYNSRQHWNLQVASYFCARNECSCTALYISCSRSYHECVQLEKHSTSFKSHFFSAKSAGSGVWSWCCDSGPNVFFLQSPTTHWLPCCTGGAIFLWGTRSLQNK